MCLPHREHPSHLSPHLIPQDCPENPLSILLWLREWGEGDEWRKKGGGPRIQLLVQYISINANPFLPLISEGHGIFNAWTSSILRLKLVASSCSCLTLMSFICCQFVIVCFCTWGLIFYLFICLAAQVFIEALRILGLIAACGICSCSIKDLQLQHMDLVLWLGIQTWPPALIVEAKPLDYQGNPGLIYFLKSTLVGFMS